MQSLATNINPDILIWAREKAGFSIDEIALSMKKLPEVVRSWEAGKNVPTYIQLEDLAHRVYKRPIAIFFFPEPPEEMNPKTDFRTLPDSDLERLAPDTLYAIRQAKAMQIALKEINEGINTAEQKIFLNFKLNVNDEIKNIVKQIRKFLDVDIIKQKEWKSENEALENWRNCIEEKGIYIFKRSFKQKDISGFCLIDEEFPLIYLNNSNSKARQIFSVFHELAHILLSINGVTKSEDDRFIHSLKDYDRRIELFSNKFASEFLVPEDDFRVSIKEMLSEFPKKQIVSEMAALYRVSREVIARKMLAMDLLRNDEFDTIIKELQQDYLKYTKGKKGGGDYHRTQSTYLSGKFLSTVFSKYYQGKFSIEQLADYLNMKVSSIPSFEKTLLKKFIKI
ncbi:MAG: ImmA/IrrE family metallo-endopeptidase [candidate division Zixibacteria bacterium]|nr:ImmA/IrrE family metallo-endopeptidase [Candidatus Tariuqbacter arcticus]